MGNMATAAGLHPSLQPVAFLLGAWKGEGRGFYPTIDDFAYLEETRFWSSGRSVLHYEQLTTDAESGSPRHCETGYVRVDGDRVEFVIAHPLGIVEIEEGTVSGVRIDLASVAVATSSTADAVTELARTIEVTNDELTYSLSMTAAGQSLQGHLQAALVRV